MVIGLRRNLNDSENGNDKISSLSYSLGDMFSAKSTVEITGNKRMVVEGIRGILEYSNAQIRVSIGKMSLQIKGRGLDLKCISPTSIIVEGFISAVEYLV